MHQGLFEVGVITVFASEISVTLLDVNLTRENSLRGPRTETETGLVALADIFVCYDQFSKPLLCLNKNNSYRTFIFCIMSSKTIVSLFKVCRNYRYVYVCPCSG